MVLFSLQRNRHRGWKEVSQDRSILGISICLFCLASKCNCCVHILKERCDVFNSLNYQSLIQHWLFFCLLWQRYTGNTFSIVAMFVFEFVRNFWPRASCSLSISVSVSNVEHKWAWRHEIQHQAKNLHLSSQAKFGLLQDCRGRSHSSLPASWCL